MIAETELGGMEAIEVETTVAASSAILEALLGVGNFRELLPTDRVLLWLDEMHLVPLRIEVWPTNDENRQLWAVRRGYVDSGLEPISIFEYTSLSINQPEPFAAPQVRANVRSGGFVDDRVELDVEVPDGFVEHRSGFWALPNGARVDVASWSDGSAWITVEQSGGWDRPRLFGIADPYVRVIDLGEGGTAYVNAAGTRVALHTETLEIVVAGSAATDVLLDVARSVPDVGLAVPSHWDQAFNVELQQLEAGTLVLDPAGWSQPAARVDGDQVSVLFVGAGQRAALISQEPGTALEPPSGPDVVAVTVRGSAGRLRLSIGVLEWVEDGRVVLLQSDTLSLEAPQAIAEMLEPK